MINIISQPTEQRRDRGTNQKKTTSYIEKRVARSRASEAPMLCSKNKIPITFPALLLPGWLPAAASRVKYLEQVRVRVEWRIPAGGGGAARSRWGLGDDTGLLPAFWMVAAVRGRGQTNGNSTREEISSPCFFAPSPRSAAAAQGRWWWRRVEWSGGGRQPRSQAGAGTGPPDSLPAV